MPAPSYSASDYLAALQALLPKGRVWPREIDATQTQVLAGLTPVYEKNNARANDLIAEAFPATAYELLPEWEASLGLPDPVIGEVPMLQNRRAQAVAKFIGDGGQSAAYMIAVAKALGYEVTVTNYAPFRCGQQACGAQLGGEDWAHTWSINAALNTLTSFRAGQSTAGEPLQSWGNKILETMLRRIAPAHTILKFHYN